MPLAAFMGGTPCDGIVKVPMSAVNRFGNEVYVVKIGQSLFRDREDITDIILPPKICSIPGNAFSGCVNLRRITFPKDVRKISLDTFKGCDRLEDVYFEGSEREWNELKILFYRKETECGELISGTPVVRIKSEIRIPVPGNRTLLNARIHFGCNLGELYA